MANRFVAEYGVLRLSIGEALRRILSSQAQTELARQLNLHLRAGNVVPDELAVQALEIALLDMQAQTRGSVLISRGLVQLLWLLNEWVSAIFLSQNKVLRKLESERSCFNNGEEREKIDKR